ncbi:MAG: hypothetical protein ACOYNC_07695 [Bacteroidales bacterium]
MTRKEITCDWIDRYNEDELNEADKRLFLKQMEGSPLLRSEVRLDAALDRFLMDEELLDLMKKVRRASAKNASARNTSGTNLMSYLLMAASILFLFLITGLFYLVGSEKQTSRHLEQVKMKNTPRLEKNGTAISGSPKAKQNPLDDLAMPLFKASRQGMLAENFESLPEFELLIGCVTRSGPFALISPEPNIAFLAGTDLPFKWKHIPGTGALTLVIMNCRGTSLTEISLESKDSYTLKTRGFREGLYYWKIMAGDDLVTMGKMTLLEQ